MVIVKSHFHYFQITKLETETGLLKEIEDIEYGI